MLRWLGIVVAAWLGARGCAPGPEPVPAVLVCPPQCEAEVTPAGAERLRAVCWCDGPGRSGAFHDVSGAGGRAW